jgi:hypothetical protein
MTERDVDFRVKGLFRKRNTVRRDKLAASSCNALQRHISPIGSSMKHFTLQSNLNALVPGRVEEANSQVTGRLLSQPPVNQLGNLLLHLLCS